jgi:glycerate kinase
MKFLFASDSFKGSLSSEEIVGILTESAKSVFPDSQCSEPYAPFGCCGKE